MAHRIAPAGSCSYLLLGPLFCRLYLKYIRRIPAPQTRDSPLISPVPRAVHRAMAAFVALLGLNMALLTPTSKLIHCAVASSASGCTFPPPPPIFYVRFDFGGASNVTIRVNTVWSPPYANLFWQLVQLGYYDGNPPFRVDYRNESAGFMAQMGWNLQPGVQDAWDRHRAVDTAVPATHSNTRGMVTMAMEAAACNASAPVDPCARFRPACTATDYCAYGGSTQFFISYGNNSRLDPHGFAPFGEVVDGMTTIEALGRVLGNSYGELQDLCPAKRLPNTSVYCVYNAAGHRSGIAGSELSKDSAETYVLHHFPLMYASRVRVATVANTSFAVQL